MTSYPDLHCGRFRLALDRPIIMGILNVTPDSFSDGGRYNRLDAALARAEQMVEQGAGIIDIGGESTRPDSPPVDPQEEMDRVLPVLEHLQGLGVPLSLDTRRTVVMQAGLRVGVDLVNDVAALEDAGAIAAVAASPAAVCLMHKQGDPQTMQHAPSYASVVDEVEAYLAGRLEAAIAGGIARERILIDPGFGFGKSVAHNYALLANIGRLARMAPVLSALSRKTMLGAVTGIGVPAERMVASVAGALLSVERGAVMVRVHDVKETREALAVWQATREAEYTGEQA